MSYKFYMQKSEVQSAPIYDIETQFAGLHVLGVSGLNSFGKVKNVYEMSYAEEELVDLTYPTTPILDQTIINFHFCIVGTNIQTVKDLFIDFATNNIIYYWDTNNNKRVKLYRVDEFSESLIVIRDNIDYFEATIAYKNVKGYTDTSCFSSTWSVTAGETLVFPLSGHSPLTVSTYVYWGDGTYTTIAANTNLGTSGVSHTYTSAGDYTIIVQNANNQMPFFSLQTPITSRDNLKSLDTPFLTMYNGGNIITVLNGLCESASNLTSICENLFLLNQQGTSLFESFSFCSKLATLPQRLLYYLPLLTSVDSCFSGTLITSIPNNFFRYNTALTNVSACFSACTVLASCPYYLFRYNLLITDFSNTFASCPKLVYNSDIFCDEATEKTTRFASVTPNFTSCFNRATESHTEIGVVPELWSYTYTGTPTSTTCFYGAGNAATSVSNYTSIPYSWGGSTLFSYSNPVISDVTLEGCTAVMTLTIDTSYYATLTSTGYSLDAGADTPITPVKTVDGAFFDTYTATVTITGLSNNTAHSIRMFFVYNGATHSTINTVFTTLEVGVNEAVFEFTIYVDAITENGSAKLFYLPFSGTAPSTDTIIYWDTYYDVENGTTTSTTITANSTISAYPSHSYTTSGIGYKHIKIYNSACVMPKFGCISPAANFHITTIDTPMYKMYNGATPIIALNYLFYGQSQLLSVCADIFDNNTIAMNSLQYAFTDCSSLGEIPANIFDKLTSLSQVTGIFKNCTSLTELPTDLFRYNVNIDGFYESFRGCTSLISVPDLFFRYNLKAHNFNQCFLYCDNLCINADIFCDDESERGLRFSTSGLYDSTTAPTFYKMFFRYSNGSFALSGTAPQLTDYIFTYDARSSDCFGGRGNNANTITNYSTLGAWK